MNNEMKNFEKRIRQISSKENSNTKLRELGAVCIQYLKSQYSDKAIQMIEKTIIRKYNNNIVPQELHKLFLETAKYYATNGEYDIAEKLLSGISDSRNVSIILQVKYESDLIKLKRGLEQGKVDEDVIEKISSIVENDENHEIETDKEGKFTDYDIISSYFEGYPVELLGTEIFPNNMTKTTRKKGFKEGLSPEGQSYIEELSAENRLKFLKDNFEIEKVKIGKDNFTGTILFEIKGYDLVIAENFFKVNKEGECIEDYGKATYILPKDATMDLIMLSRGELKEKQGNKVKPVSHGQKGYYTNLIKRFNEAKSELLQRIEQKTNPLENVETKKRHISADNENIEIKNQTIEKDDELETDLTKERASGNEQFLNVINENLGGIITPEIMDGFLTRVSYSFENLYNRKLKKSIYERLDYLEVPDEKKEVEAQKVFLYIRMAKNISMINSGAINGQKLSDILDDAVIEYDKAMSFFEMHITDNISYKQMQRGIKEYIETGKDILKSDEEITEKMDIKGENEEVQNEEIQDEVVQDEVVNTLLGENVKETTKNKALDIVTRYLELIKRNEELEAQNERAEKILIEKAERQEKLRQATIDAEEQVRQAKLAAEEAMKNEQDAEEDYLKAKEDVIQLKEEQKELQDKISKIEDMLH